MDMDFLSGLGICEEAAGAVLSKYCEEVNGLRLDFAVERELSKRGVKSMDAALKLLDKSGLNYSDGKVEGLTERIDEFSKNNDFLFSGGDKPYFTRQPVQTSGISKADFDKMGYEKRLKLFNESPELYKRLTKN